MSGVDVLAVDLFEAYSRNSGNPPDTHFDRNAAEQWMAQALVECGVAALIEADVEVDEAKAEFAKYPGDGSGLWLKNAKARRAAALARVTGGSDGR